MAPLRSVVVAAVAVAAAADCTCKYQGQLLPDDLLNTLTPALTVARYGTMCAAWDQVPDTPWASSCAIGSNWSSLDNNWCQLPWCYVDASCETAVSSGVFTGSTMHYSYHACGAPDCYNDDGADKSDSTKCPYDPDGEEDYMVHSTDCECLYQGGFLPDSLVSDYPSSDPGKWSSLTNIKIYGTTCGAWDQSPETPWVGSCPSGSDWCSADNNWCQVPWCYVSSDCASKVASGVFEGSGAAYYSYETCLGAPDCYATPKADACPFDESDLVWGTGVTCPDGFTDDDDTAADVSGACELPALGAASSALLALRVAAAAGPGA